MLSSLDRSAVESFLKICRREIPKGNCYLVPRNYIINGKKIGFRQVLLDLGIMSLKEVWDFVLSLTVDDLIDIDFDRDKTRDTNSEIYEFKKKFGKVVVYVKLTLRENGVICLSFHEDYYSKKG